MTDMNSTKIAKLAGVSRSTVSRVINNYSNVPAETRKKVLDVIKENNYYPNLYGQTLAGKKTETIVLFIIESGYISQDPLSNYLITSVIESASKYGYYVLTSVINNTSDESAKRKMKGVFHQGRVDGGVVIGADNEDPVIEELISEGFIIGVLDQEIPGADEPNRIAYRFDNEAGAMTAVDYLIDLNHKEIGIINGNVNRLAGPQRYQGYLKAMKKHNLSINPDWVLSGSFNRESGYEAIVNIIKENKTLPTAIFSVNDSVAFGAIQALQEHSIQVPDDMSIIGMDDHLLSPYIKPALTTVKIEFDNAMRNLTADVINVIRNNQIDNPPRIGTELIVRHSCKSI